MDIDIKHVPVDTLVQHPAAAREARQQRLEDLQEEHAQVLKDAQTRLETVQKLVVFIDQEHANVVLAGQLAQGDIVRVVCHVCQGTGMKPSNVLGGRVSKGQGSAFENTGPPPTSASVINEHDRCQECKGQRWVIMERFKG